MHLAIIMNEQDHVATLLTDVDLGSDVTVINKANEVIDRIVAADEIPFGNKLAIKDLVHGEQVSKYGYHIGVTRCAIKKGELVHVHNLKSQKVDIPEITATEVLKLMGVKKEMQWEDTDAV